MNPPPAVGVVVVVRNAIGTIGPALESVLAQEPAPFDVLVLDGASADGSAEHAASYGVRVVPQRGLGLGAARNQALDAVEGELVAFCDADDLWTPGSLACRVAHLWAHAGCDAVIGHVVTSALDDDGSPLPARHVTTVGVARPGYTPGALLTRRRVFDFVGRFDEALQIGTDSDWFVRLRESTCRLDVLDDVVLHKRVHNENLSHDVVAYRRELMEVARSYVRRRRSGN